jgi:phenylalanyl-tRNA synthetase alpha chain
MADLPQIRNFTKESIEEAFESLSTQVWQEAMGTSDEASIEAFRVRWLGRKNGILTLIKEEWFPQTPAELKKLFGMHFNSLRGEVEDQIRANTALALGASTVPLGLADEIAKSKQSEKNKRLLGQQKLDITLPGIQRPIGVKHPVLRVMDEIVAVFKAMGYSVGAGPEVETDYYNFESLNFPPNHPARDTQDTLFIAGQESKPTRDRLMLRTHTSPVQIRTMEQQPPPVRIVIPGKVHRNDPLDATHSPVFHQVEGLAVDTNITFCDLKGTLDHAMKALFGSSVKTRFYPSFFPFTEPSADMQVSCIFCGGKGCRKCKGSGWIELLGCGMVDPNVFDFVKQNGYDSSKISGFAFGMGADRIALLKYEVEEIQSFFQGDVRFLEQFA